MGGKSKKELEIDRQYCNCKTTYEKDWKKDYPYICGSNTGVYDPSRGLGLSVLDFVKLIPVVGEVVSIGDAIVNLIKGVGSVGENVLDILLNTFTLTLSAVTMGMSAPAASSLRASVVSNKISVLTKIGGRFSKVRTMFADSKIGGKISKLNEPLNIIGDVKIQPLNTMGDLKGHSDWVRTYAKGFSSIAVDGLNGCPPLLPTSTDISSDKWKNLNYAGWMEGVWTADFVMQRYRDPMDNLTYNDIQTQVDQAIFYYINASWSKKDCQSRVIANSVMHGVKRRFETCYTVTTKMIGNDKRTLGKTQAYNDLWKIGGPRDHSGNLQTVSPNTGCSHSQTNVKKWNNKTKEHYREDQNCCWDLVETQNYWEPKYEELPLE